MAAKKTSTSGKEPKQRKRRWYRQLKDVFLMTRREDPAITWWLLGAFLTVMAVAAGLGLLFNALWYALILGFPSALLVAMIILGRRAEKAAYTAIEGRPGAALAALNTLRRGWIVESEPAAIDPRTQDLVVRVVGRPGVVLVSEGPSARVGKLLDAERRRVAKVLPNVPIYTFELGREEGQIPLPKLTHKVNRLRGKLTASELAEVGKRLRALRTTRLPVPKGIDPLRARPDRKGMRGR